MAVLLATWPAIPGDLACSEPEAIIMATNPGNLATPGEVAAQLSIAPSTLRSWSAKLAPVLSIEANPPKEASGRIGRRLYNPSDVSTLTRARDLLASGLPFPKVLAILQTEPQPPAVQEPRALATSDLGRALMIVADQRTRLDDLEHRIADLEKEHRPFWRRWLGH